MKTRVTLEEGTIFLFFKKEAIEGVKIYNPKQKTLFPACQIIKKVEPKVGEKLKFSYDTGFCTDEFESSAKIVSVETC